MKIQLIRNATLLVEYGGIHFLVDPMLSEKGTLPTFPNSLRKDDSPNPLVELPVSVQEILHQIDAVFLSHLHVDHWDTAAIEALPKSLKIFVQDDQDLNQVISAGFQDVEVLTENTTFKEIRLSKTKAQHGRGEVLKMAGNVAGLVLKHLGEKTLYIAADTVWFEGVQQAIDQHGPDVIVVNGGDNQFAQGGSLVMGKDDIKQVYKAGPKATLIVVHMEAVNHYTLTRAALDQFLVEQNMADRVLVPADGQSYTL